MELTIFFKALADETRLRSLLLILQQGELCVCELTEALALSQPKISRHLAQLRTQGCCRIDAGANGCFIVSAPSWHPGASSCCGTH